MVKEISSYYLKTIAQIMNHIIVSDPCVPNPCGTNANCVELEGGSYKCVCPPNYKPEPNSYPQACNPGILNYYLISIFAISWTNLWSFAAKYMTHPLHSLITVSRPMPYYGRHRLWR